MTTINQEEIQKFSKLADEWWDANGKFKPLHAFNPVRIKYIIDKCKYHFKLKKKDEKPLSTLKVLDIGCGGGLVCEPLSRLGADVTGIDASFKNIEVAKIHAKKSGLKIAVHITDLSYRLNQHNPIFKEAESRISSVYTIEECFPMLPVELSNNIFSLKSGEQRNVLSFFLIPHVAVL